MIIIKKVFIMIDAFLVSKSQITFNSPTRKAQLKHPVDSLIVASFSTILSLGDYILYNNPTLNPPNYFGIFSTDDLENDHQYPQKFLTYNKLFEPWCDYLSELLLEKKVSQRGDILFLCDSVADEYLELLNSDVFEISDIHVGNMNEENPQTNIGQQRSECYDIRNPSHSPRKTKKIGLINFALSQNRTDFVKPKIHPIAIFTGILYNDGDQWAVYNALKGQYPSVQDYMKLDTVILSGSTYSVNDQIEQVEGFVQTLREAIIYNPKLKILAICFGHQTLAKMFGGVIKRKQELTRVQRVDFDQQLIQNTPFFKNANIHNHTFELSQYHKDFVVEIPSNFTAFARSETCEFQSIISQNKQYLSFQFHPEYSAEYIKSFQMRLLNYHVSDMQSSYSQIERGEQRHTQSLWQMRKVIRSFLNWTVEGHS